jgi:hypothetical protein
MSMHEVWCQECGRRVEVNSGFIEDGLVTGEYVKGQKMVKFRNHQGDIVDQFIDGIFDICKVCQSRAVVRAGDPTFLQSKRIMQTFYRLRETRPDLTDEERRAEAVRAEFDPNRESNRAFREFLMERVTLDPESDVVAHRAFESIK